MSLSLVHVNIERDRHLERLKPFLAERMPDVLCVQEIFEKDVPFFEDILDAEGFFVARHLFEHPERGSLVEGLAIFSRSGFASTSSHLVGGNGRDLKIFDKATPESRMQTQRYELIVADIPYEGMTHRIATTHLPVTAEAIVDDIQRGVMRNVLSVLSTCGEFVLTGDLNTPRGDEVFSAIAAVYHDNVPAQYTSSIDGSLHRAGPLPYMVDGIFTTPAYQATNVEMVCGVSDHCALTAQIDQA